MTAPNKSDGDLAATLPCSSASTLYALSISNVSASITLPNGCYRVIANSGGGTVFCKIGGAATIPTSGNSATGEFALLGGIGETFFIGDGDGTKSFNAILSTGTDTLYITKLS